MEDKQKLFYIYKHLLKYKRFHFLCRDIKETFKESNNYMRLMNEEYCYAPIYSVCGVYYTYSKLYKFIKTCGPDAFFNIVDYCLKTWHNLEICNNWVEDLMYYHDERIPLDFFSKEKYGR